MAKDQRSPLSVLDILALESPSPQQQQHVNASLGALTSRCSSGALPPLGPRSLSSSLSSNGMQRALSHSMNSVSLTGLPGPGRACSVVPPSAGRQGPFPQSPKQLRHKRRSLFKTSRMSRSSSLNDKKVLLQLGDTKLKRTASLMCPDLFQFEQHFEFLELIGRSQHCEVFKVRHMHSGDHFAVKKSTRRFQSKAHRERCMHEIMAVAALPEHDNIVGQFRAWQQEGHFYIQMDLCEGGSLAHLLQELEQAHDCLSEEELWYVLWEVAQGLAFLHLNRVLHLDVKPDNIYRTAEGVLKVGDFGLAVLKNPNRASGFQWDWEEGDGDYVAPELLKDTGKPSPAADVYSLGATLFECATGKRLPHTDAVRQHGHVLLPGRSAALQWVLQSMLHPDPAARPSAQELVDHVSSLNIPFQSEMQTPSAGAREEGGPEVAPSGTPEVPHEEPGEQPMTPAARLAERFGMHTPLGSATAAPPSGSLCQTPRLPGRSRVCDAPPSVLKLPDRPLSLSSSGSGLDSSSSAASPAQRAPASGLSMRFAQVAGNDEESHGSPAAMQCKPLSFCRQATPPSPLPLPASPYMFGSPASVKRPVADALSPSQHLAHMGAPLQREESLRFEAPAAASESATPTLASKTWGSGTPACKGSEAGGPAGRRQQGQGPADGGATQQDDRACATGRPASARAKRVWSARRQQPQQQGTLARGVASAMPEPSPTRRPSAQHAPAGQMPGGSPAKRPLIEATGSPAKRPLLQLHSPFEAAADVALDDDSPAGSGRHSAQHQGLLAVTRAGSMGPGRQHCPPAVKPPAQGLDVAETGEMCDSPTLLRGEQMSTDSPAASVKGSMRHAELRAHWGRQSLSAPLRAFAAAQQAVLFGKHQLSMQHYAAQHLSGGSAGQGSQAGSRSELPPRSPAVQAQGSDAVGSPQPSDSPSAAFGLPSPMSSSGGLSPMLSVVEGVGQASLRGQLSWLSGNSSADMSIDDLSGTVRKLSMTCD